jgi:FAD/FMN-containing dehydrogenase
MPSEANRDHLKNQVTVNDVTRLNPIAVWAIAVPDTIEAVQDSVRRANGRVSVGGGHFSMGGQTASPGSLHLDMRQLNRVISFHPLQKRIRVQAGIRWCDIQRFIDPHDLSVSIMQTYANFTVGGSLSVNVHGRYVGSGPLILSVLSIRLVMASGELMEASREYNSELFYAAIGGYNALGIIVEAELQLAENVRVKRDDVRMPSRQYASWFREAVRNDANAVFHNADLYPPHYQSARAVTWRKTQDAATVPYRLQPVRKLFPLHRYFYWMFTEAIGGKWRREHILDPLIYLGRPVHWRNYEAGYDAAELEPVSRKQTTYVLQEYFVPVTEFDAFLQKMALILQRFKVNVVNISVRHAHADSGAMMSWARGETYAFVLYYKQRTRKNAIERVAVWARELINAVISCNGTYYLPYQLHATPEQFHRAYPRARELFLLKKKYDPQFKFSNALWDKYYAPTLPDAI